MRPALNSLSRWPIPTLRMRKCCSQAASSATDVRQTDLSVPAIHCGGCIQKVEAALGALPGVEQARVNLSTKRVAIRWQADKPPAPFIETLNSHRLRRIPSRRRLRTSPTRHCRDLIRALAVAGFAASNIMLLSVSVWSGRGRRDPQRVSLDLRTDRLPGADLFRPRILSARPGARYGTAGPTWTCRSPSACCSPSA